MHGKTHRDTAYPYPSGMDPVPTIVDNIRRLMAAREWTQVDLSKRSRIAQNTISRLLDYERLRRVPSVATVAAIADAFGIPVWQLQIPHLPTDLLGNRRIGSLVGNFVAAEAAGRERVWSASLRLRRAWHRGQSPAQRAQAPSPADHRDDVRRAGS